MVLLVRRIHLASRNDSRRETIVLSYDWSRIITLITLTAICQYTIQQTLLSLDLRSQDPEQRAEQRSAPAYHEQIMMCLVYKLHVAFSQHRHSIGEESLALGIAGS